MRAKLHVKMADGSAGEYDATLNLQDFGFEVDTDDFFFVGVPKEILIKPISDPSTASQLGGIKTEKTTLK
jgi:hypothetical protein